MIPKDKWGVHAAHCCKWHGCKYGQNKNCPVVQGKVKQKYLCEDCDYTLEDESYYKQMLKDIEEIKLFIEEES